MIRARFHRLLGRLFAPTVPQVLAAAVFASSSVAQVPGDELPRAGRARTEFLAATLADVKLVMTEWLNNHRQADGAGLARMFTDDGLFSPAGGWSVQGRKTIADTLVARIAKVKSYHATLLDFTASGGLAYYLGRMSYHLEEGPGLDVRGTFVMVLYQEGRRWKVRSYVERSADGG